ncbi:hypothetical protein RCH12_002393 [Cryobacterium sp. MP_3.1]|uniref:hypothetical protein n=1 Tax=Cryobacterium sp. MP_3.1 TaxID=3071711 RepID=UPI002E025F4D|nr:hypothetical protein [Cryobacterium sp. MP_3.1]
MNKRQLGLAALGLTALVASAGVVVAQRLPPTDRFQSVAASTSPTAQPTPERSVTPTPADTDGATPDPVAEEPTDTGTDGERWSEADAAPRTSTEVLPEQPESVSLPPSKPRTTLVSLPLPPTASSTGTVVGGFPTDVMPGIPESVIDNTSVATEGDRMQAALEARTSLGTTDVLAFYRQHFAPLGLLESPTTAAKRSTTLSFARGDDSITLAVTAVAGGSSYVLFGAFTAQD